MNSTFSEGVLLGFNSFEICLEVFLLLCLRAVIRRLAVLGQPNAVVTPAPVPTSLATSQPVAISTTAGPPLSPGRARCLSSPV